MPAERVRIRLRLATGTELEAEGTEEFVRGQLGGLLSRLEGPAPRSAAPGPPPQPEGEPPLDWPSLVDRKGPGLALRGKVADPVEAALILIMASEKVLGRPRPNATGLARWLRASGYDIRRADRTLSGAIRENLIIASGAKRARRYDLSPAGRIRAWLAAETLRNLLPQPSPGSRPQH